MRFDRFFPMPTITFYIRFDRISCVSTSGLDLARFHIIGNVRAEWWLTDRKRRDGWVAVEGQGDSYRPGIFILGTLRMQFYRGETSCFWLRKQGNFRTTWRRKSGSLHSCHESCNYPPNVNSEKHAKINAATFFIFRLLFVPFCFSYEKRFITSTKFLRWKKA